MTDSDCHRRAPGPFRPVADRLLPRRERPGRRCSTGCSPASTAERSCCGSRTPTTSGTAPSGPTGSSRRSTGSACRPTRAPTSSPSRTRRTRRRSRRSGPAVRSTRATAPARRSTSAPATCRSGRPDTRLRRPLPRPWACRAGRAGACGSARPTRASRSCVDLVRGDVEFPNRAIEDFICVKGNGKPLFVLANVVDDRAMAITHVIRGEDLLPTTPKQIMLWQAPRTRPSDTDLAAADVRPSAPAGQRAGQEALQAAGPGGGGDVPRAGLSARRPFATTWPCLGGARGDEEIVPLETLIEPVPARGRATLTRLLRREEAHAHERRLHPGAPAADFVAASRPWVDPVPGEWAPGGGAIPTRGAGHRSAALAARALRPGDFAALAPVVQERVAVLGEVPAMVDFLFLEDPPIDPTAGRRRSAGDEAAPSDPARRP